MATAKRRINSTNRKRIGHEAVDIRLLDTPPGTPLKANASLQLADFGFPSSAEVAIEAYRSSSLMRFDCGTIGNLKVPPVMLLNEIDAGGNVQFRVKVIDRDGVVGRLLGSASRVRAQSSEDEKGRRSLLPIRWKDLGPELWQVTAEEEEPPALVLNMHATGLVDRILTDVALRAAIMPAAFKMVLEKMMALPQPDDDDDTDWKNDWLKFCRDELEVPEDPYELIDPEDRRKWVSEAVKVFAERAGFVEAMRKEAARRTEGGANDH